MKEGSTLDELIQELCGSGRSIESRRGVSGGDINEAYLLTLDDGTRLFLKSNLARRLPMFSAEAEGLRAIRATGKIGVPEVFGIGIDGDRSFLLMEYVSGGQRRKDFWDIFARELAAMHQAPGGCPAGTPKDTEETRPAGEVLQETRPAGEALQETCPTGEVLQETRPAGEALKYGFPQDNWIGYREQINTPRDSWIEFFRDCRLEPQFEAAQEYFSREDRKRADWLLSHLDRYLMEPERPSLIHGDLWAGNMIPGNDGKGWLIDPAVCYGCPEADIAMTELFGGFPRRFYEVYRDAGKLDPDYGDRRDLYNLYQLLNHLNMFGASYLSSVLRILTRYAGEP